MPDARLSNVGLFAQAQWQATPGTEVVAGVRYQDVRSESFLIAKRYMIRLEERDLADDETVARLAAVTNLSPDQFRERFEPVARMSLARS